MISLSHYLIMAAILFAIGMVEFGLMYVFYIHSFRFLAAHQVAQVQFGHLVVGQVQRG